MLNDSIVEQKGQLLGADSAEAAGSGLVKQKLLTPYQSEVLVSGDRIPLVVGDYVVTDSIGRGGMGYVLKARHRRMKRTVAIKFLLKSLTESNDLRQRFEREVEAAAQLDHQNIVTAYDAGVHEGSHYLVMQYVNGDDLSHIVKSSGPLGISRAVDVIRQAALGLGYAHDQGIIHRDIKPGNLLLDSEGVVRILDMGLARMMPSPGDELEGGAQADLTNTGSVMGTIDYMAPEQALDAKSVDHRADIYALGCTLYFLLTSNPPFRNETVMRRLLAHREQPAPRISEYRPGAPRELDDIFATMMAKSPDDRFPSMKHLVVALDSLGLNDSEAEQMATMDMPDDESGGFISVPDEDVLGLSDFGSVDESSTGSMTRKLPNSDATMLETPSHALAMNSLENVGTTAPDAASPDTGFTGIGETIIGDSPSIAGAAAARGAKPQPPWKLIAPVGLAVVALIAFLMTRPDPATNSLEPTPPNTVVGLPQGGTQSDDSPAQDADCRAAEWVISHGGKVSVEIGDTGIARTFQPGGIDLPVDPFRLTGVTLRAKLSDDEFAMLAGLTALKQVDLESSRITDAALANLKDSHQLKSLNVSFTSVTEDGLAILENFSQLEELSLPHGATSVGLAHVVQLSNLKSLEVPGRLTNAELAQVVQLSKLKSLTMGLSSVTNEQLSQLSSLRQLEKMSLDNLNLLSDDPGAAGLQVLRELPNLTVLSLQGCKPSTNCLRELAGQKHLRELVLSNVPDTDAARAELAKFDHLETLWVEQSHLSDEDLVHFAKLTNLRKLSIPSNDVTAEGVTTLSKDLPNCRIFSDHGAFGPTAAAMTPDRRGAEWVLSVGGRIHIDMPDGTRLQVEDRKDLPDSPFVVRGVEVQKNPQVTDDGLMNLRGCSQLGAFHAYDTAITDQGLANLTDEGRQPLRNLQSLFIARTEVSDTGLRYLADSKDLWYLDIQANPVSDVSLLRNFRQLRTVGITRTKISAEDLAVLQVLPLLRDLSVDGRQLEGVGSRYVSSSTKLSKLAIQYLRPGFDGAVLTELQELTKLDLLELSEGQLDDVLWSAVAGLPKLDALYLDGDGVADASIGKMPALANLRVLTFKNGQKKLSGETIAAAVRRAPALQELVVTYKGLNDGDARFLESLTQLTQLTLSGNDITTEGINSLHVALPDCRIICDHGTFGAAKTE